MATREAQSGRAGFPLMEKPAVGVLLAFVAGLTNAWTLAHAGTFSTVQSGNIVQIGYRLAEQDWPAFRFALWSVVAFGLGSGACGIAMAVLADRGRAFARPVLAFEVVALAALALTARAGWIDVHHVALGVSFVAGAQGNAFHKTRGMLYGNVAVTFVVQMAFNFLARSLFRRDGVNGEPNLMWAGIFLAVLAGFAAGGCVGFVVDRLVLDHASLFLAGLVLFAIWLRAVTGAGAVDPTPGGVIA
ncbi:MAG TPA: YoaK family protein [Bauldia sp.]|nr:YoaK family protein [Bauldia sp.]